METVTKIGKTGRKQRQFRVAKSVTVRRSPQELYDFWRSLENLPRVSHNLESVTQTSPTRSHWVAKAALGQKVEWDSEITTEDPNHLLRWRTTDNYQIQHEGEVRFEPAPGNQGTEVVVDLRYSPLGGKIAALIAKVLGKEPEQQISQDLGRFKALMETGEIPTTEGQPAGGDQKEKES